MSDNLTLPAQQGSTGASTEALLKVEGLTKHFPIYGGFPDQAEGRRRAGGRQRRPDRRRRRERRPGG
ncbi:hypothetical protein GCM10019016_083330 [Streptomyces prasinosporus]|uniref:Uncharacterized protein n=1 Tax=Streptomyces prasinosporus TaxID=68256 RepID=A0ABP6U3X2_9ACTN